MITVPGIDPPSNANPSPRTWQKALVFVIALLAIIHTVLIAAWLAPTSPVRDFAGQSLLRSYIDPYFQQSWSAIDPNSQRVDETLRYRAQVLNVKSSKKTVTPWFDLTGTEDRSLNHNLAPARFHLINRRLATNLNATTFALNAAQLKIVNKDYVKVAIGELSAKLREAGPYPGVVSNYVAYDQMTVQFLSLYVAAQTGDEVLKIQYKIGRRTVPAFKDRKSQELRDEKFSYFSYGWRQAYIGDFEAQSPFNSYLRK